MDRSYVLNILPNAFSNRLSSWFKELLLRQMDSRLYNTRGMQYVLTSDKMANSFAFGILQNIELNAR